MVKGCDWVGVTAAGGAFQHAVAQAKQVGREGEQVDAAGSDGCMYLDQGRRS